MDVRWRQPFSVGNRWGNGGASDQKRRHGGDGEDCVYLRQAMVKHNLTFSSIPSSRRQGRR